MLQGCNTFPTFRLHHLQLLWPGTQEFVEGKHKGKPRVGVRKTCRGGQRVVAHPLMEAKGTEVEVGTYPSQEGGGPVGHGRSKHSKTKHKKHSRTQVLKKPLAQNKWIKIKTPTTHCHIWALCRKDSGAVGGICSSQKSFSKKKN